MHIENLFIWLACFVMGLIIGMNFVSSGATLSEEAMIKKIVENRIKRKLEKATGEGLEKELNEAVEKLMV